MFKKQDPTKEDIEDYNKIIDLIKNLKDASSVYNIEKKENVTANKLSSRFFIDNLIMSAVMEAFYSGNEIYLKDINNLIHDRIPQYTWLFKMTRLDNQRAVYKLVRLGFLQQVETKDKLNLKFEITNDGIKALQDQTFQNLAASSFFSYQTYKMNIRSFWMTILMLIVTIMSVIVTLFVAVP